MAQLPAQKPHTQRDVRINTANSETSQLQWRELLYTRVVVGIHFCKGQERNIYIFAGHIYMKEQSSGPIKLDLENRQQDGFFPPTNHSSLLARSVSGFQKPGYM